MKRTTDSRTFSKALARSTPKLEDDRIKGFTTRVTATSVAQVELFVKA
jgi:hypothetical protein